MSVAEDKPVESKRKKWVIGFICLVAVAVSLLVIVREIPPTPKVSPSTPGISRGGGYPGGGGAPGGQQMPGARGQITAVSADAITIQGRDGGAKTFAMTAATKITVDQKVVAAADLSAGQRARIVSTDGKSASEIHVRTRPPGGRGGGRGGTPGGGPPPAASSPS